MSFLPDLSTLLAFTAACLVLVATPGPDMTLFLGKTLGEGRAAGIAAMLGAMTGLVVHTLFAAFGLSALLAASQTGFTAVKIAGALYLCWLAVQTLRHGSALSLERKAGPRRGLTETYLAGLGINLLNPKVVLFFVTFLPQFVSAGDPDAAGKLLFLGLFFIVVNGPICFAMILTADRFTAALRRSRRVTRAIDYAFAGIMGAFALKMLSAGR